MRVMGTCYKENFWNVNADKLYVGLCLRESIHTVIQSLKSLHFLFIFLITPAMAALATNYSNVSLVRAFLNKCTCTVHPEAEIHLSVKSLTIGL